MNAVLIAGIVFACAVAGIILGVGLQRWLPPRHLDEPSKDIVKLGTGLIATMAALVLGLLIGAAKGSFDEQRSGFQRLATDIILLDRSLGHYGPDAAGARGELEQTVAQILDNLWPGKGGRRQGLGGGAITARGSELFAAVQKLPVRDEWHQGAKTHVLQLTADLARQRWELSQSNTDSLPKAFLVVLAFWLFVLFTSFGIFSPRNTTVVAVLLVCALSVAGAIFLIVDLDQPFEGLIQLSDVPLREAQAQLGKSA